jgi:carbamate kinase
VVPSPRPVAILEAAEIALLVEQGVVVTCAGGGGIPVVRDQSGTLRGIEAVVDKDLTSALLAGVLKAEKLLLLTDVDAIYTDFGSGRARAMLRTSPALLAKQSFPSGSMGPKVEAAADFVTATGGSAAIGRLEDALRLVTAEAGTQIDPGTTNIVYRP